MVPEAAETRRTVYKRGDAIEGRPQVDLVQLGVEVDHPHMHPITVGASAPGLSRPDVHPDAPPGHPCRLPPHIGFTRIVKVLAGIPGSPERIEKVRDDGVDLATAPVRLQVLDTA